MKASLLLSTNQQVGYQHNSLDEGNSLARGNMMPNQSTLNLIKKLCQVLEVEGISYCHWKSNNALDRSASGDNDLDLLIDRADASRFTAILHQLGFKQAIATVEKQMIGVLDYFGYDEESGRLVHVHAHSQLVLGHDMTKNFRIPIEKPYLKSAVQGELFRVPSPEFEFIVFIIRMNLKYSTWDIVLRQGGKMKTSERQELKYLQAQSNQDRVNEIISEYIPNINIELFEKCKHALEPSCSNWTRIKTGQQLQKKLRANARRPFVTDAFMKLWNRGSLAFRRRAVKSSYKHRLANGGVMIAIIGGDGAGKTTAVNELFSWLSTDFGVIKVHMGKPRKSLLTYLVRGILKIGYLFGIYPHLNSSDLPSLVSKPPNFPGKYPWMIREVCKARDRYKTYIKSKSFANNGGIVISDRFPNSQINLMDGPTCSQISSGGKIGWFGKSLVTVEEFFYGLMISPEIEIVFRLDPSVAVQRKTDEDSNHVRIRSTEIWEIDWQNSNAKIIDANGSKEEVTKSLKSLIWSEL